ncbi:MAG: hypothetical protein RL328_1425, partial [Acidobacteriota bacterium]
WLRQHDEALADQAYKAVKGYEEFIAQSQGFVSVYVYDRTDNLRNTATRLRTGMGNQADRDAVEDEIARMGAEILGSKRAAIPPKPARALPAWPADTTEQGVAVLRLLSPYTPMTRHQIETSFTPSAPARQVWGVLDGLARVGAVIEDGKDRWFKRGETRENGRSRRRPPR